MPRPGEAAFGRLIFRRIARPGCPILTLPPLPSLHRPPKRPFFSPFLNPLKISSFSVLGRFSRPNHPFLPSQFMPFCPAIYARLPCKRRQIAPQEMPFQRLFDPLWPSFRCFPASRKTISDQNNRLFHHSRLPFRLPEPPAFCARFNNPVSTKPCPPCPVFADSLSRSDSRRRFLSPHLRRYLTHLFKACDYHPQVLRDFVWVGVRSRMGLPSPQGEG